MRVVETYDLTDEDGNVIASALVVEDGGERYSLRFDETREALRELNPAVVRARVVEKMAEQTTDRDPLLDLDFSTRTP